MSHVHNGTHHEHGEHRHRVIYEPSYIATWANHMAYHGQTHTDLGVLQIFISDVFSRPDEYIQVVPLKRELVGVAGRQLYSPDRSLDLSIEHLLDYIVGDLGENPSVADEADSWLEDYEWKLAAFEQRRRY